MSRININGVTYTGNNIIVKNNKVIINGNDVTSDTKIINITVEGNLEEISADYCEKIIINGNVGIVTTMSGNIECNKDILGNVRVTSGDIDCENIGGNVETVSGDVKCGNITGNVRTVSGDIRNKKQ
jgi:hypothetical protein